jgi:hypothetical protein
MNFLASDLLTEINLKDSKGLFKAAMEFFRQRTMGTLEATNRLYGHHAYVSSVAQRWIPSNPPENRDRLFKPKKIIEEISESITEENKDDPYMSLFTDNFIDVYYPKRPKILENYSLFMVVSNFK